MVALLPAFVAPVLAVTCPDNGNLTNGNSSPNSGTTNTNFHFTVTYQDNGRRHTRFDPGLLRWRELPEPESRIRVAADRGDVWPDAPEAGGHMGCHLRRQSRYRWHERDLRGVRRHDHRERSPDAHPVPTPTPTPTPTPVPTPVPTPKPIPSRRRNPRRSPRSPRRSRHPGRRGPRPSRRRSRPRPLRSRPRSPDPEADGHAQDRGRRVAEPVRRGRGRRLAQPDSDGRPPAAHGVACGGCRRDQRLGRLEAATRQRRQCSARARRHHQPLPRLDHRQHRRGAAVPGADAPPEGRGRGVRRFVGARGGRRRGRIDPRPGASAHGDDPAAGPQPAIATAKARPAKAEAAPAEPEGGTPRPRAPSPQLMEVERQARRQGRRGRQAAAPELSAAAATVGVASWAASDLTRPKPKTSAGPQTFSKPPGKGVERLKVGYRMVRLSEGVDDVSSRELGRLDRGDEVEVVGSYEGFLQVKTPDGLTRLDPQAHDPGLARRAEAGHHQGASGRSFEVGPKAPERLVRLTVQADADLTRPQPSANCGTSRPHRLKCCIGGPDD